MYILKVCFPTKTSLSVQKHNYYLVKNARNGCSYPLSTVEKFIQVQKIFKILFGLTLDALNKVHFIFHLEIQRSLIPWSWCEKLLLFCCNKSFSVCLESVTTTNSVYFDGH